MSIFKISKKSHLEKNMFFDGGVDIQRFDVVKYPRYETLTQKQLGFFWRPEEVDVGKDKKDFMDLTDHERHIFTSNLKRQILLDSVQGRAPAEIFAPICSLPELEAFIMTWTFSETIHSRSYTHIIRNVYSNPSKVFDELLDIKEIVDCAADVSVYYDSLLEYNLAVEAFGYKENTSTKFSTIKVGQKLNKKEHKRRLWLALMSVNILEGVRFYVSFACSWAFAELKKMEGNAKIIKFIARDENLHLAATQSLLRDLVKEDKDFEKIKADTEQECINMFMDAIEQEKQWADYLFKDGSIIGLNAQLLKEYIDWIGSKRMNSAGLKCPYSVSRMNPLGWTEKWIGGSSIQAAPQETEIHSYTIGAVDMDVDEGTFKGFKL